MARGIDEFVESRILFSDAILDWAHEIKYMNPSLLLPGTEVPVRDVFPEENMNAQLQALVTKNIQGLETLTPIQKEKVRLAYRFREKIDAMYEHAMKSPQDAARRADVIEYFKGIYSDVVDFVQSELRAITATNRKIVEDILRDLPRE